MKIINHRINTIAELKKISFENGIEIDVRDFGLDIVLAHDPFKGGELLEEFIKHYNLSTLIINTKSEGVEFNIIELLEKYNIKDFFFLDSSFAIINEFIAKGNKKFAVRLSEKESIETVRNFKGLAEWVWVDCFTKNPLTIESFTEIKEMGFKICIVSPDLVGRPNEIETYVKYFEENNLKPDAVCVKRVNEERWLRESQPPKFR